MKKIKRFINFILVCLISILVFNYNVFSTSDVTSVKGGAADFYVESTYEAKELDFGVKYRHDLAYSRINDSSYSVSGAYDAGGSANSSGPLEYGKYYTQNINVMEIPTDSGINIVSYANIKGGLWTLTSVKAFITRYEQTHPDEKVIAAINGDFFDINSEKNYPKTSTGGTVCNGNYYKVNSSWKSIGFKNDENGLSMIGNILPTVSNKPVLELFDENNNLIYSIDVDNINQEPSDNQTSAFFTFYDDKHNYIAEDVNNAYIFTGDEIAPISKSSVYGYGKISDKNASTAIKNNQFAIETNNSELKAKLELATYARVQYTYVGELEGYDNVIGYPANLVLDGEVVDDPNYRHPRTMIGTKEDGTIVMMTVDGRRTAKGYYGLAPIEQSAAMIHYGCTNAFNLDGGGSTTMVILEDGEFVIKNEPSDNSPRSDGNCLLLTVKVPTLKIEFENVKETSFDVKVEVEKKIEKYNDLYIEINNEKKKIENGSASYSSLSRNTAYVYKIYALVNDKYVGLPITGQIFTAKKIFEILGVQFGYKEESELYTFILQIKDDDKTVVNTILEVNGKKYYLKDGMFQVPVGNLSNINSHLILTYDLNDKNGRIVLNIKDLNATYLNASQALESISNDCDAFITTILGN
ncbi:MAG: phosphodiester glycosidase family protein [Bacilli bacterium]|nr:phosphodiester glycosidase family protein [Bacilli bacterium]